MAWMSHTCAHIWLLRATLAIYKSYEKVIIPEMNTGQFKTLVRDQFLIDAKPLNKTSGQPFTISEITRAIKGALL